jgi:carboxylesterase type B
MKHNGDIAYVRLPGGFAVSSKTDGVFPSGLLRRAKENSDDSLVFVAINYRIGVFGFLGGPTLQKDGIANAGLYDQRFAFEWVQKNIHLFGGDPSRVTIMGNSAGGGSIVHQVTVSSSMSLYTIPRLERSR